ncbi:LOW QUALITY PROTEIN: cytosolic non-specific dipeptidase-like [Drosophila busckii]|uniref:LOW QUALITY PROTEIN: cytosolic non-specific dipeptidase-like n=1 Tax=Drosophila busckii TaxID=30019 RepID=UPI001432BAF1|nr:LOW QUALITY PROTEIN: cytosolic non-specific dipeptidase-like [Drosophila busckii]
MLDISKLFSVPSETEAYRANSRLNHVFQMISLKRECSINDLWELIAHETVSTRYDNREELQRAIDWLLKRLVALNLVAFSEHMGSQMLPDSWQVVRMPKMIIALTKQDNDKPTILVYGNLDVEEALPGDGWRTEPFVMSEKGGYMYGRGVAFDKGPLLCWLNAVQAYRKCDVQLPINLVFVVESMAHSGSLGLETVLQQRISFFRRVDCVVMANRRWQSNLTPAAIYGGRGLVYYQLEVECANRSLSSCEHAGSLYEALPDLIYLLSNLMDTELHLLFNTKAVASVANMSQTRNVEFKYRELGANIEAPALPYATQLQQALICNWFEPHLSIHGIEGCSVESDARFIIPHKVIGKFSISLAPNQIAEEVTNILQHHLGTVWALRDSPNHMQLCEIISIPPWTANPQTPEYDAALSAMEHTYKMTPNLVRDGAALLAPSIFQRCLQKNVLVLPIAQHDYGGTPVDERLSIKNYIDGQSTHRCFSCGNTPSRCRKLQRIP